MTGARARSSEGMLYPSSNDYEKGHVRSTDRLPGTGVSGITVKCRPRLGAFHPCRSRYKLHRVTGSCGQVTTWKGEAPIGLRVGKVLHRFKMAKHFRLDIREAGFFYARDEVKIAEEAALDGIYVVRTSVQKAALDTQEAVRAYKDLGHVEQAFRSYKTADLKVRPIYHYLADRVRVHVFLCMLAYYVEWRTCVKRWRRSCSTMTTRPP
jgi:hypothetical protein